MIEIRGWFKDIHDNDIVVEIQKQSDENVSLTIGENGIYFAGDSPVTITQDVENEFQIILSKQCTINLITDSYVGDYLFADNARDVEVVVTRYINQGNQTRRFVLFAGFLEPITFSQGYAHVVDSFTLTAHDYLGTLEYLNYKDITLNTFDTAKQDAANRSFKDILYEIIPQSRIWFDQSKGIDQDSIQTLFDDLGIFDIYMIGETFDDLWTQKDVLEEMLRYLNLHIVMVGSEFYIFDWDSLMNKTEIVWLNLGTKLTKTLPVNFITLTKEYYADEDTNVTVSDVYNQIQVTDELESLDELIKSPLDNDSLQPLYPRKSWYMTEFISEGEGEKAREAFEKIIDDQASSYDQAKTINWFIQPMYNPDWKLYLPDGRLIQDLVERDSNGMAINAYKLPLYANEHSLTPLILNSGSAQIRTANNNSPIASVDMTPYLFISIKGNNADPKDQGTATGYELPIPGNAELEQLHNRGPILEYVSNISGGTFSPVDEDTTNYIIFSGKMILQTVTWESDRWFNCLKRQYSINKKYIQLGNVYMLNNDDYYLRTEDKDKPFTYGQIENLGSNSFDVNYLPVPSKNNEDGRFYTRRFYKDIDTSILYGGDDILNTDHSQDPYPLYQVWDFTKTKANLNMWTDDPGKKMLEYKYTVIGDKKNSPDLIKKLPILECSLVIGDKCLVEYDMDDKGDSKFKWVDKNVGLPVEEEDDEGNIKRYNKFTFTLGIDPDTDNRENPDYIIGQEYDFQNTVDTFTMDLNGPSGTAIPIKRSDELAGKVEFKILGPVNLTYDEITRRNGDIWYWHSKWSTTSRAVLSHLESIIIKDFEAKLYTSGSSDAPDSDLIYVSDETDRYISKNDDTTFKFITQLSSAECLAKGIKPSINQNAVLNIKTNIPVSSLYNAITQETAKAEELFVDQYYRIFSTPKVRMETTIKDGLGIDFMSVCDTDYMRKQFYVLGIDQDLKLSTMKIKIKEF